MTKGNGWRIALFLFLVTLVIAIITLVAGIIVTAVGTDEGIGFILAGLIKGLAAAFSGMVTLAITAATYRQLALRAASDIFS